MEQQVSQYEHLQLEINTWKEQVQIMQEKVQHYDVMVSKSKS
jgi:hypothetical protein